MNPYMFFQCIHIRNLYESRAIWVSHPRNEHCPISEDTIVKAQVYGSSNTDPVFAGSSEGSPGSIGLFNKRAIECAENNARKCGM